MKKNKKGVFAAVRSAAATHKLLSTGTLLCTAASVLASLLPPLLLGQVIDSLTDGVVLTFGAVLVYFGSLALEGALASGQEILLEMFGQKMTHALRSEMSQKLTHLEASTLAGQNPGEIAARFSGDVDTVEALFTSGVISIHGSRCLPPDLDFCGHCCQEHGACAAVAPRAAGADGLYAPCAEAHAGGAA